MENHAAARAEVTQPPLNLWTLFASVHRRLMTVFYPFLLLVQTGLTIWLVGYQLTSVLVSARGTRSGFGVHANEAPSGKVAAILIIIMLSVSALLWMIPCGYAAWSTWIVAQSEEWRPRDTPEADIMRVDDLSSFRRLWCEQCGIRRDDRMAHCWQLGRCLPYFDHECAWWAGVVWAHNVKAYLLFVTFLPLFHLVSFVVSIWVFTNKIYNIKLAEWYVGFTIINAFSMVYSGLVARTYAMSFLWYNILEREWGSERKPVFIYHHGSWTGWKVSLPRDLHTSPWNLGYKENWRQIMGKWWTVLFFWTETPLVRAAKTGRFAFRPDIFSAPLIPLEPLPSIDHLRRAATTGSDA
jgi:hypothetical protein